MTGQSRYTVDVYATTIHNTCDIRTIWTQAERVDSLKDETYILMLKVFQTRTMEACFKLNNAHVRMKVKVLVRSRPKCDPVEGLIY